MSSKKPFYEEGLRFECQGSGKCCTSRGSYGFVYLTANDRKRFATHMKMTQSAFTRKYCDKTEGHFHLKNPDDNCQFLDGKRCGVYAARPSQCRTWPFWPENMTAKAWNKEVASFCPGVGKGRVHSKSEIEEVLASEP